MQVKFKHSHINDPSGSEESLALESFILKQPGIGLTIRKAKAIPPFQVVNELLASGKNDAGMGGCFEWEPFEIQEKEFWALKQSLEQAFEGEALIIDEEGLTLKRWMSLVRSQYKDKPGHV
jgi:hypothetical protein